MLFFIWYRITPIYDSIFAKICDTLLIGAKETKCILFIKHNRISLSQKTHQNVLWIGVLLGKLQSNELTTTEFMNTFSSNSMTVPLLQLRIPCKLLLNKNLRC